MRAKCSILILLMTACVAASGGVSADPDPSIPLEYRVKAAFLYRFVKFVEWPGEALPDTHNTITIGVLGEGDIYAALESLVEGKQAKGRKLVIQQFREPEDLEFCHVLFIGRSEKNSEQEESRLKEILKGLKGSSTLTVGEAEGFAQIGGMINFIIVESKVRFEINVGAAREANLKISSKLLRLARIVKEEK